MPSYCNPLKRKYETAWEIARNKDYPDEASKLRALQRLEEEEKFEYKQQQDAKVLKTTALFNSREAAIARREDQRRGGHDPLLDYQQTLNKVKYHMEEDFHTQKEKEFLESANKNYVEMVKRDVRLEMQFEVDQDRKKMVAAMNKEYEDKMGRLRGLVDSKLRPEFQKHFEQERKDEMHRQVEAELRPVLLAKIWAEEKELLKIEAEAELRPILLAKIREEEKEAMRAEIEEALRPDIEQEIRESIEAEAPPRKKRKYVKKSKKIVVIDEDVSMEDDILPVDGTEPEVAGPEVEEQGVTTRGNAMGKAPSKTPAKTNSKTTAIKPAKKSATKSKRVVVINEDIAPENNVVPGEDVVPEDIIVPEDAAEPEVATRGKGKGKAKVNAKGRATAKATSKAVPSEEDVVPEEVAEPKAVTQRKAKGKAKANTKAKATSKAPAKKKSSQKVTTGRVTKNKGKKAVTKRVARLLESVASEEEDTAPQEDGLRKKTGAPIPETDQGLPVKNGPTSAPIAGDIIPEEQNFEHEVVGEDHDHPEEVSDNRALNEAVVSREGSTEQQDDSEGEDLEEDALAEMAREALEKQERAEKERERAFFLSTQDNAFEDEADDYNDTSNYFDGEDDDDEGDPDDYI